MDIQEFLTQEEGKEILRFSTAGSVDDGKSTLIGRLLHDSKSIYEDQLSNLEKATGSAGGNIDWALLTDGLKAEREQGITIDVAYRYFATPKRKYIIADTPGHEQYTRNMATGASTADLAIILIDARNGIMPQSKRHAFIASLLQIPHMVVAVNKMDLMDYEQSVFETIRKEFSDFATRLNVADIRFIPISALEGDNVVERSERMPWYHGESLLELLDNIHIGSDRNLVDFRFPVQYVSRPHQDFRGYCGQVVSGVVRKGDEILVLPSLKRSRVSCIETYDGGLDAAFPPLSVTLTLEDEVDISRGDMLVHPNNRPKTGRHFEAMIVWMDDEPLDPQGRYILKQTTQTAPVTIAEVRYMVDVNTLHKTDKDQLGMNEIGRVVLMSHRPLFYDPYDRNRATGSFILIDAVTNRTSGAGMIIDRQPEDQLPARMDSGSAKGESGRVHQSLVLPQERRERLKQNPVTIWLTGFVSAGKSEIAYALERFIFDRGGFATVLMGGQFRQGLSRELAFNSLDMAEHLRRVAESARILNEAGLVGICSFVSPKADLRAQARDLIGDPHFLEVHVASPLSWSEARDQTGLYAKARAGELKNLVGVDVPYEPSSKPELVVRPDQIGFEAAAREILDLLVIRGDLLG